ncbi:hypothetical protein B0O80DRAFT_527792 [Mortierella sp. GBAus27b]|nr:hypothetical protein BGX31_005066 [Mortierella sp. GBA43]KAI8357104.1 hypothetical protein B0O80DRAFT_527792 [Mortierella sp. GBAus27b]
MKITSSFATLASILFLATTARADDNINNCDNGEYMEFESFTHTPVKYGTDICITVVGNLKVTIDKGSEATITASLGVFTAYDKTVSLCGDKNTHCSVQPGSNKSFRVCFPAPASGPANVKVDVNFKAKNQDGKQLSCLTGSATTQAASS